mgnify:CR=1 FL=1
MKHLLPLLLLVTSSAWAQDLSAQRQNAQTAAEKSQVELHLDQPYAGNENPKQKVDLYLPKKRNTDKPLPVVALIHGGGWVNGDRLRLVQALRNLMLNAIQAMSRSGGELRISSAADETHRINLCITDNGPGFTEKALTHAQDLFFSEREGGMGVGLSLVSEVIAAHGGTLQLANHQPHGASVTISLPRPTEPPVSPN